MNRHATAESLIVTLTQKLSNLLNNSFQDALFTDLFDSGGRYGRSYSGSISLSKIYKNTPITPGLLLATKLIKNIKYDNIFKFKASAVLESRIVVKIAFSDALTITAS